MNSSFLRSSPFLISFLLFAGSAVAGIQPPLPAPALVDHLASIRAQVSALEESLTGTKATQNDMHSQLKKIQKLLKLQRLEQSLGQKRLAELEHTIVELESRRTDLKGKMDRQQKALRLYLSALEASSRGVPLEKLSPLHLLEQEKIEAPHRKVLANLVDKGLKEIEILHVDLSDAIQLEGHIQDERIQLTYLYQDLKEQEGVLELNRQVQLDLLKKKRNEHLSQFENYRKLKSAESQVEHLIKEFNARKELERSEESEKVASQTQPQVQAQLMTPGMFVNSKGRLPFPVEGGRVISEFGRAFDHRTGLYIFKKGIEIQAHTDAPVKAVSAGKVVFSGILPNYGQVVIIDHGDHYYSLCAHLGSTLKQMNAWVKEGDRIGQAGSSGIPLYFEIRSRNIAVNPLQWLFN